MAHTMSTSKGAKQDQAKTPNPPPGSESAESQDQRTNRAWPGKSEPGHIRPIGPARRPASPNSPKSNQTTGGR
jgi:hypothetical protein